MPEIIELPTNAVNDPIIRPGSAAAVKEANRAAEDRANKPAQLWSPAPSNKPENARVSELKAEAEAARAEAVILAAKAEGMSTLAKITAQKISNLESQRGEVAQRLANVERVDFKSRRETARGNIHLLYGKENHLSPAERVTLNDAVMFLAWSPVLEKELPIIVKNLKARLGEIEKQLAELTGTGN
jgi:hypothetical protein